MVYLPHGVLGQIMIITLISIALTAIFIRIWFIRKKYYKEYLERRGINNANI